MILEPLELATYAADVDIPFTQQLSAILQAQSIAEGTAGANRPLERQVFEETRYLNSSGFVLLSRMPVVSVQKVEIRGGEFSNFNLTFVGNVWNEIRPQDYLFDDFSGEIHVKNVTNLNLYSGITLANRGMRRPSRPLKKARAPQVRVTYTTGFDFTDDTNIDVLKLKTALGGIVSLLKGGNNALDVKAFELTDFYKVDFTNQLRTSKYAQSMLDELLVVFRGYRPREFF